MALRFSTLDGIHPEFKVLPFTDVNSPLSAARIPPDRCVAAAVIVL
jgi:hypothetical protein